MEPDKKTNGALVGLVVIIIILVIGGIYMWKSNENATTVTEQDSVDLNSLVGEVESIDTNIDVDIDNLE